MNCEKLFEYKKEFDMRHEFDESETDVLRERFSTVKIVNIPVAWIFTIDNMLSRFKYNNIVKEVRQEFGQLIVLFSREPEQKYLDIVNTYEQKIKEIDSDIKS